MADFVTDIINTLKSKAPSTIGVSVNQSGLLEICVFDNITNTVKKYGNRHIKYNLQTREIENLEDFAANVSSLYQELDIPVKSKVILSLPSVAFGVKSVPLILDTDAIESVLIGDVEQSYLFKKQEPLVAWREEASNERSENKTVSFAAISKKFATDIIKVFSDMGSTVIAIDNSNFNLLNTIPQLDIVKEEIESKLSWNIVLVTYNSYVIFSMSGANLVEYYEEPLALRSLNADSSINETLAASINESLPNYMANSILVISDSDDVDAAKLSEKITFHGTKKYLNQNTYSVGQIVETSPNILPSYFSSITLYAIGSSLYRFIDENLKINLILTLVGKIHASDSITITVGSIELEVNKDTMQAFTILVGLIIVVFFGLLLLFVNNINQKDSAKIADLDTQITNTTNSINELKNLNANGDKTQQFDLSETKLNIVEKNKQAILYYNLLSFNIPKSTWITHFYTNSLGAVLIEGKTSSTNNVYLFFKGIKAAMEDSDLALTKLKYANGFEDIIAYTNRVLYEFELSNAQYATAPLQQDSTAQENPSSNSLENLKQDIQKKVDNNTTSGTEKTPDLPPIEDIKNNKSQNTEKLTKDDVKAVENKKSSPETQTNTTKSEPNLPDLPDIDK